MFSPNIHGGEKPQQKYSMSTSMHNLTVLEIGENKVKGSFASQHLLWGKGKNKVGGVDSKPDCISYPIASIFHSKTVFTSY